jgi:membrane-bound lytic murein transglycosylase D
VSNADIAALNNFQPNAGMIAGQVIKVPVSKETVARKLNNQPIKYTVKSGDSLTSVAARHGITIKELADANNLNTNSNLLLGTTITIPAAGSAKSAAIATPAHSQSANTQAAPSQAAPAGNTIANTENYTVQSGEHLTGLATRFGVSVNDLAKTNNLATNAQLRRGQVIKVPKLTTTYKVKSGDNLISLARRYGISTEELAKMNNLENNASLRIGQTLTVPNK